MPRKSQTQLAREPRRAPPKAPTDLDPNEVALRQARGVFLKCLNRGREIEFWYQRARAIAAAEGRKEDQPKVQMILGMLKLITPEQRQLQDKTSMPTSPVTIVLGSGSVKRGTLEARHEALEVEFERRRKPDDS